MKNMYCIDLYKLYRFIVPLLQWKNNRSYSFDSCLVSFCCYIKLAPVLYAKILELFPFIVLSYILLEILLHTNLITFRNRYSEFQSTWHKCAYLNHFKTDILSFCSIFRNFQISIYNETCKEFWNFMSENETEVESILKSFYNIYSKFMH